MPALELLLDFDFLGFDFSSRASSLNDSFVYRKLIKELPDKLSVEVWVAVFSKLIENEPVAQIGLVEDELETFPDLVIVLSPHRPVQQVEPHHTEEDGQDSVGDEKN